MSDRAENPNRKVAATVPREQFDAVLKERDELRQALSIPVQGEGEQGGQFRCKTCGASVAVEGDDALEHIEDCDWPRVKRVEVVRADEDSQGLVEETAALRRERYPIARRIAGLPPADEGEGDAARDLVPGQFRDALSELDAAISRYVLPDEARAEDEGSTDEVARIRAAQDRAEELLGGIKHRFAASPSKGSE